MQRNVWLLLQMLMLATPGIAQSRVSVGLMGGLQTSLREFDGGRSVQAVVLYRMTDHVQFAFSSGYLSWQGVFDGGFRAIPFLVGLRVHPAGGDIVPYGKLDVGLYSTRTTTAGIVPLVSVPGAIMRPDTMELPLPIDVRPTGYPVRSSTTTFGYDLGVGMMLTVSEQWALDVGATVHYLDRTRPDLMFPDFFVSGGTTSSRYFTAFTAGVLVRL
jgi:opacity protein-like surface antigen